MLDLGQELGNKKEWEAFRDTYDNGESDDVDANGDRDDVDDNEECDDVKSLMRSIERASESQSNTPAESVFGRVLERLGFFANFADTFFEPAPETVKLVWSSCKALLTIINMGNEARKFVGTALDQVSEWIVVAAVYVKRYEDAVRVQEKIPPLLKTLLRFTFEIWRLGYLDSHETQGKRISRMWNKTAKYLKGFASLLMGKIEQLKEIIKTGNGQFEGLLKDGDFAFQDIISKHLEQLQLDAKHFASLLDTGIADIKKRQAQLDEAVTGLVTYLKDDSEQTRQTLEKIQHDLSKASIVNDEYERMYRWLCLGTPLQPEEPMVLLQDQLQHSTFAKDWTEPESISWIEDPAKRLCWLYGPPGLGKSYTTSLVIKKLLERFDQEDVKEPLVIFFFCRIGSDATERRRRFFNIFYSNCTIRAGLRCIELLVPEKSEVPERI